MIPFYLIGTLASMATIDTTLQ